MQAARELYSISRDAGIFEPPPKWPRIVARIFGTFGLMLISPVALFITFGTIIVIAFDFDAKRLTALDLLVDTMIVVGLVALTVGLLIAWWWEGAGAGLIFAGALLLVVATYGFALAFVFPAFGVAGLYLFSWALHRTDDAGSGDIDRLSRWIREKYYGRRPEIF